MSKPSAMCLPQTFIASAAAQKGAAICGADEDSRAASREDMFYFLFAPDSAAIFKNSKSQSAPKPVSGPGAAANPSLHEVADKSKCSHGGEPARNSRKNSAAIMWSASPCSAHCLMSAMSLFSAVL